LTTRSRQLGTRYLAELERLAPAANRIADKMPGNFMFAGLIHLALPNAIIIHTNRDPVGRWRVHEPFLGPLLAELG